MSLMLVIFPQGSGQQEEEGRGGGGGEQPCAERDEGEDAPGRGETLQEEGGERPSVPVYHRLFQGGDAEGELWRMGRFNGMASHACQI